jgi:hypothetical protein
MRNSLDQRDSDLHAKGWFYVLLTSGNNHETVLITTNGIVTARSEMHEVVSTLPVIFVSGSSELAVGSNQYRSYFRVAACDRALAYLEIRNSIVQVFQFSVNASTVLKKGRNFAQAKTLSFAGTHFTKDFPLRVKVNVPSNVRQHTGDTWSVALEEHTCAISWWDSQNPSKDECHFDGSKTFVRSRPDSFLHRIVGIDGQGVPLQDCVASFVTTTRIYSSTRTISHTAMLDLLRAIAPAKITPMLRSVGEHLNSRDNETWHKVCFSFPSSSTWCRVHKTLSAFFLEKTLYMLNGGIMKVFDRAQLCRQIKARRETTANANVKKPAVRNARTTVISQLATDDDDEVTIEKTVTLAERNTKGFANAILLD